MACRVLIVTANIEIACRNETMVDIDEVFNLI